VELVCLLASMVVRGFRSVLLAVLTVLVNSKMSLIMSLLSKSSKLKNRIRQHCQFWALPQLDIVDEFKNDTHYRLDFAET
jgi:hypothetical protein